MQRPLCHWNPPVPEACVRVGDLRCYPLADGDHEYPTSAVFPGRSDEELEAVLPAGGVSQDLLVGYSGLLVDTGKQRILIDTGAGPLSPTTGRLLGSLTQCGFSRDDVDVVVLSHLHADHIGGLLTPEGDLTFPNAEFITSRVEHEFWMSEANQTKLQAGELFGLGEVERILLAWIRKYIPPLAAANRLRLIDSECEAAPGVLVFPAFGHTPGHLAVLASQGNQQLLFGGDAFLHPAHIQHPQWLSVFEVMPDQTVETRRALLDRAASDHCLMFLFHFPFPCLGTVSRKNNGYGWEPMASNL